LDSVFSSVNSTNIANVILKFRQNFDTIFLKTIGENTQHVCANR
jgi:hypothetical protein